ncbi:MAG TPA: adenylosuccinate lyase [Candidatus Korarchaeota archaeon]|nr:adenylosuccinate lyase [Candidatus Korarchaeota archaeon]
MPVHPIDYRYGSSDMRRIFEPETKIRLMARFEAALAKVQARHGLIPREAALGIEKAAEEVTYEEVKEEERVTKHETMALVKVLARKAEPYGGYVHLGVTSNDVLDTAMALQIKMAGELIVKRSASLLEVIIRRGEGAKGLVTLGRTHGVVADPIPLSLKFALWSYLVRRSLERFIRAVEDACVGKVSGAVGTMAALVELGVTDPKALQYDVLLELGIKPAEITTQVVPRDRLALLITCMSLFSSSLDTIANEIRNLHRTEIGEIQEYFEESTQVGSSTMPHKRNPVKSEKVCGLAKVMRSLSVAALENIVLEHERDLTNSSAERCLLPEAFLLLEEQLITLTSVIKNLKIVKERIEENLKRYGELALSERLMIALVRKGMGRQTAHETVRRISMRSYSTGKGIFELAMEDKSVRKLLTPEELRYLADPYSYVGIGEELAEEEFQRAREFLKEVLDHE